MRAMVIDRFGGPEVLQAREMDRPEPGPGEVLVRVVCAGTNPVDAKLRQNASWAGLTPPLVLGSDASGVVEAVGPGVTEFSPGDEVYYMDEIFGNTMGTYAEYNAVPARIVARKPASLSHEQAAAVPLAGGTAWEAIVRRLNVRPGETVLIHGGAGGVGSFAVQFARAAGARVLATASASNQDVLRELGADVCIDYGARDFAEVALRETGGRGVDATFDTAGGDLIKRSLPATRPFGRLACILTPAETLGGLSSRNQTLHGIFVMREADRLREMAAVIEQGRCTPLIGEVMPLEDVRRAHERLDSGHGTGKLILRVTEG
ncbi:zinc-dependent alcohol dehydrogenase family protein [Longimicrobium sp.]|uniref:zinc-dependent alcohol dehydrogenase family protein n=1 Tax=Longimicrobium sp. TaxID=2029185 RepID=UPI002E2FC649|nr:zinc-dependent alcohol dehydrogenase family protein [Longimicrobium sp.]HEX6039596.1 zinc-dependent alcohol dehydrogenase family protein [Longimicrobium sp.]